MTAYQVTFNFFSAGQEFESIAVINSSLVVPPYSKNCHFALAFKVLVKDVKIY